MSPYGQGDIEQQRTETVVGLQRVDGRTDDGTGGSRGAGVSAHVFMPQDASLINILEVQMMGADLHLVNGLINDAGREAAAAADQGGWFDVSTLKEPYRLEGKKIMGDEVGQAFEWELPDVIIYPTGGGTGLIGMWKAFDEMEKLGWIGEHRPRMVTVQAEGCAKQTKSPGEQPPLDAAAKKN